MPNNAALNLHGTLEEFEHHLDTYVLMAEMGMCTKEANDAFAVELTALRRGLGEFVIGQSVNDGMAKQASRTLDSHISALATQMGGSDPTKIASSAKQFKEALSQARRTYLSRDALGRFAVL